MIELTSVSLLAVALVVVIVAGLLYIFRGFGR